jgi:ubiquinone/menaquinone biosynthesis C-methylase UbiE
MEPALQRRIQRYGWDKASAAYETFWQKQLKPAQDQLLKMADIQNGEKVLDLACGTGLVSFRAAAHVGKEGMVLGTDISDKMIEFATEVAKEKNLSNIKFQRMDAEDLPLTAQSFDVVLCALGLMYMPNPLKAMREIYRVLRPGGRAVAAVWGNRENCGWAEIFPIVDSRVSTEVCPMFFNLGKHDILLKTFGAAGFENITTERLHTVLHYASAEEACGAAFAGGPVALAYFKFDDSVKEQVHAEYLDSIKQHRQGNGYEVPGEFVVTIGFKK